MTDANCQALASDELISKAITNEVLHIKSSQLPFYYHNINSNPLNRILLHTRITSKLNPLSGASSFQKKKKKRPFGSIQFEVADYNWCNIIPTWDHHYHCFIAHQSQTATSTDVKFFVYFLLTIF